MYRPRGGIFADIRVLHSYVTSSSDIRYSILKPGESWDLEARAAPHTNVCRFRLELGLITFMPFHVPCHMTLLGVGLLGTG